MPVPSPFSKNWPALALAAALLLLALRFQDRDYNDSAVAAVDLSAVDCVPGAVPQERPSFVNVEVPFEWIEWPPEDGDTFEISWRDENGRLEDAEIVRFLGADTPEIEHPEMCWYDAQPYADEATDFTAAALEDAGTIEIVRLECTDYYLRTLAYVLVDGANLSAELVWAGLAHANVDKYGHQGAIDEAREVELADRYVDPLGDENPHDFRGRMRALADQDPRCR